MIVHNLTSEYRIMDCHEPSALAMTTHNVIASVAKQSIEAEAFAKNRLPRAFGSRNDYGYRHCERSEAIHRSGRTLQIDYHEPMALAMTTHNVIASEAKQSIEERERNK